MVLCKRRPDAEYRLYSIGTYGNAALALVQADSKTVITFGKGHDADLILYERHNDTFLRSLD